MTENEVLFQPAKKVDLTLDLDGLRRPRRRQETPTRLIARQLSYLEQQVLRIEAQLNLIDLEIRRPRKRQEDGKKSIWARLNPWHAAFDIWVYVSLLSFAMLIAFAVQVMWA
jgi:hypothetical protein